MKNALMFLSFALAACSSNDGDTIDNTTARQAPINPPGALATNPPMSGDDIDAIVNETSR